MNNYKKIRVCFRLDRDLTILIPELLSRTASRENISEFLRVAARERFIRLAREYNTAQTTKAPAQGPTAYFGPV